MNNQLWRPSEERIKRTNMFRFMQFVNQTHNKNFTTYNELYQWSVEEIPSFWDSIWKFADIKAGRPYTQVVDDATKMPGAKWFTGAKLNFAENLLRYRDDRIALSFKGESNPKVVHLTYAELYDQVARLARSLRETGIQPGDRIAGFMPNMIETIVAMLATTSLGAVWTSCSPDFGTKAVLDRFGQAEPKILIAANGYSYNGKTIDCLPRIAEVKNQIPSIEKVIVVCYTDPAPDLGKIANAVRLDDFSSDEKDLTLDFVQLPVDHPLYIMYSSGTTGVPKCIVHGAGGTLIQHLKELMLHTDLSRSDTIFYFTTCGWMMWNWLVSSLAVGARVLLFDGSPFYPGPEALWRLAQDEGVTVFGTSAKYLASIEKENLKPAAGFDLTPLKAILSTGSPLSEESFEYVYRDIKEDVCLSSISGGTDIISCFALGNPMGPVYAGQLQCRGLGMKVAAYNDTGKTMMGEKGELVCQAAAPSMPIYFWNDPDGAKYESAYFSLHPGVWSHGDYIEITETEGVIIYGRSDATLNPGGVRIGTAEIYRQVETIDEVADSIVVGQNWDNDVRVILFVKLMPGVVFDAALEKSIRNTIRKGATPRHVPAKIIAVDEIPYTMSGKKVELAVRRIIQNQEVKNREILADPKVLDYYRDLEVLKN